MIFTVKLSTNILLVIGLFLIFVQSVQAKTISYLLTGGVPTQSVEQGEHYWEQWFDIEYEQGQMVLALDADGTGQTLVDDALNIQVYRPNGTMKSFTQIYQSGCIAVHPKNPVDISARFLPGINQVRVRLYDICGQQGGSSQLYLVNLNVPGEVASPFLRLPWDYEQHGLSFSEAALAMTSYFDHTYPLLSASWAVGEPINNKDQVTSYKNLVDPSYRYSSHDGYDYAKRSKALVGESVLAAAAGCASYHYNTATGNALYIDHHNGYQTRYYHLQKEGLITQSGDNCIEVTQGQAIAKIGFSGNVIPAGVNGAHIHFMVVHDKNDDDDFEDNIPDGIVDPFGWQNSEPDPWETFAFTMAGVQKTGDVSYYLWQDTVAGLSQSVDPDIDNQVSVEKFGLSLPTQTTTQPQQVQVDVLPGVELTFANQWWRSLGTTVDFLVYGATSVPITTFDPPIQVSVQFDPEELGVYDPQSLTMYSRSVGGDWQPEETVVDWENYLATTTVDHLSEFALMAQRRDVMPPMTQLFANGQEVVASGSGSFAQAVTIELVATDDQDGVGVDTIWYQIENGDWTLYEQPVELIKSGSYQIQYYAIDADNNAEEIKSSQIVLDATPLEAQLQFDIDNRELQVDCIDEQECQVSWKAGKNNPDLRIYKLVDAVGNMLKLRAVVIHEAEKVIVSLKKLIYNQSESIDIRGSRLILRIPSDTKRDKIIQRRVEVFNTLEATESAIEKEISRYVYFPEDDYTKIVYKLNQDKLSVATVSGKINLKVTTDQGKLIDDPQYMQEW